MGDRPSKLHSLLNINNHITKIGKITRIGYTFGAQMNRQSELFEEYDMISMNDWFDIHCYKHHFCIAIVDMAFCDKMYITYRSKSTYIMTNMLYRRIIRAS